MANKRSTRTRTNLSTVGTELRSVSRINLNNFNSFPFSFVLDKILQLEETPVTYPIIHSFSSPDFSNSFEVFHYNFVSIKRGNNFLANVMINPSHETSLFSRNLFQELSRTSSAFSLEFTSQEFEFSFNLLDLRGFKELPVRSDSKIIYAEVNAKNSMRTRNFDINLFSKSEHKKASSLLINSQKAFTNFPSEISNRIIGDTNIKLLPPFNRRDAQDFILERCTSRKIISHRNILDNWLSFSSFNYPASLFNTGNSKLRRQSFFTQRGIDKRMQFNIIPNFSFPSLIDTKLQPFRIKFESSNYLFSGFNFNFNCGSSPHCNNIKNQDYLNLLEGISPPTTEVMGIRNADIL